MFSEDSSPTTNSPPTSSPPPAAQRFMAALAKLVAPERSAEAETALAPMLALLADVPDRAWSSRSCLEAVATVRARGVPNYSEIRKAITAWTDAHATPRTDSVGERAGLTGTDALWCDYYWRRKPAVVAADEERVRNHGPFEEQVHSKLFRLGSLVRYQSPEAWRVISGSDGGRLAISDAEREAVAGSAREAVAGLAMPRDQTPRSTSIENQMAAVRAGIPAGTKLGQLTPEQLTAARVAQLGWPAPPPPERTDAAPLG